MAENVPYNEQEVLGRIAEGDQPAFVLLFNELYPRLVIFTEAFTHDRTEAEDIASEAFATFWGIRGRFEAVNQIKSFLYITARNRAFNVLRSRKNCVTTELTGEETVVENESYETEIMRAEIVGTLFHEIELLPQKYRDVMLLTYREGLSTKQVSAQMGITISHVTTLRSRAIQQLKIKLHPHYPTVLPVCIGGLLQQLLMAAP